MWVGGKVTPPDKLAFLCEPAKAGSLRVTFLLDCMLSYRDAELGTKGVCPKMCSRTGLLTDDTFRNFLDVSAGFSQELDSRGIQLCPSFSLQSSKTDPCPHFLSLDFPLTSCPAARAHSLRRVHCTPGKTHTFCLVHLKSR